MSTSIPVDDLLIQQFRNPECRCLKVIIDDNTFVLGESIIGSDDPRQDFQDLENKMDECCIFLFRTEGVPHCLRPWIMISFIPDSSLVRLKMIYSACRESLRTTLGNNLFTTSYHMTDVDDLDWSRIMEKVQGESSSFALNFESSQPILNEDEIIQRESDNTQNYEVKGTLNTISFGSDDQFVGMLVSFRDNNSRKVLTIMVENEVLKAEKVDEFNSISDLGTIMSTVAPRFYLFHWDRKFRLVSMQPAGVPIREGMIYSIALSGLSMHLKELEIVYEHTQISSTDDLVENFIVIPTNVRTHQRQVTPYSSQRSPQAPMSWSSTQEQVLEEPVRFSRPLRGGGRR